MARKRSLSRPERWAQAVADARSALDATLSAAADLKTALEALAEVRSEYEDWRDNLPDNLSGSALADKLGAVCDLELDLDPESMLQEVADAVDEAEGADLPLGFGRD